MKFPVVWIIGIALLIICQFSSPTNGDVAKPDQSQTPRKELDLYTPLEKINRKLQKFLKSFNIGKILEFVDWFLANCLATNSLEFPENLATEAYNKLMEHPEQIEKLFGTISAEKTKICQSPVFAQMHKQIWVNDTHLSAHELVRFFHKSGFSNIYTTLRIVYLSMECPRELIDDLPTTPDDTPLSGPSTSSKRSTNLREQFLAAQSSPSNPFPFLDKMQASCDLVKLIGLIQQTGLLDLVLLIDTLLHEVMQKPSIHFLVGKIQEPAMGQSFRELRNVMGFREITCGVDDQLKGLLQAAGLIDIVGSLLGIDLCSFSLIETIYSLLELILWQTTAAMPGYNCVTPPTACI